MAETVLVVAHGHPELSVGGGEIVAYQLFEGLRQTAGVTAWFIAADDPTQPPNSGLSSVFAGRPNEILLHSRSVDPFHFAQRSIEAIDHFAMLVRRIRPDIIHFHHYMNLGLELIAAARRTVPDASILLTLHEYLGICAHHGQMVKTGSMTLCHRSSPQDCARCFPSVPLSSFIQRQQFVRAHFDLVDAFIAPSGFLRRRYVEWGLPAEQIVVLENPTLTVEAPPLRPLRAGERRSVFGFFGQINPYKGLSQLLSAFALLGQRPGTENDDIRLMVHGSYLELNPPAFVATVRGLLVQTTPRTEFGGAYSRDQLRALMEAIDWVVVPSIWWENAPLIIEEALAHRRPVICSNIGGMAEKIRPGEDGFHFPVGDVPALADLLARVTANPTIWDELQRTMRVPITIAHSVAEHRRLYSTLADRRRTRRSATSITRATIGTARIVELCAGLHMIEIRPGAGGQPQTIHICAAPGEAVELSPLGGIGSDDVWLAPQGGTLLVKASATGCRLIVTEYSVLGSAGEAIRVSVEQFGEKD